MTQEIAAGSIIKLTKDHIEVVNAITDDIKLAQTAFKSAARWHQKAEEELWETLYTLHPEIKPYRCRYNYDGKILVLAADHLYKKEEDNET